MWLTTMPGTNLLETMQNLQNFFKNPFNTGEISDDNMRKFAEDHQQRLTVKNSGGVYTSILTPTVPLVLAFGTAIDAEDSQTSTQQGKTILVDKHIDNFKKAVSRREGAVRSAFGTDSSQYQEFFPHGLTEYSDANKGNVFTLMTRMMNKSVDYAADLGTAIGTEFTDIRTAYEAARIAQQTAFGSVEDLRTATATARAALVEQLGLNLLFIAGKNLGHPDRLDDFMDQSIIRRPSDSEDGTLSGIVQGGAILNIESQGIDASTQFTLRNKGVTQLLFALSIATDTMPQAAGLTVAPGETRQVPASALGPAGNTFLNVQNLSADVAGGWEVMVL